MLALMKNQSTYNLRANLRTLIGTLPSISKAAQVLDINRQQLNKYLAGTSTPSLRTLVAIATHFDISVDDMFMPPDDFRAFVLPEEGVDDLPDYLVASIRNVTQRSRATNDQLTPYCGLYYRLSTMPTMPHKIIRALTRVYQKDGFTFATTSEVFPTAERQYSGGRYIRRLNSFVSCYGDRIYFLDATQETRLMMMIFYPEVLPSFDFLHGRAMSVSDVGSRKVYQIPVVLQRLGHVPTKKSMLSACGIFDYDSPEIDEEVRNRISLGW